MFPVITVAIMSLARFLGIKDRQKREEQNSAENNNKKDANANNAKKDTSNANNASS